jgi:putative glycosyltransferase (TIGR04348 family)
VQALGFESFLSPVSESFESQWDAVYGKEATLVMVALNAVKCYREIALFRSCFPGQKVVVAVTGTDQNEEEPVALMKSLTLVDDIIVLQEEAKAKLPQNLQAKTRVVLQGAEASEKLVKRQQDGIQICVVGHLRAVKDPLRAAMATRLLPAGSKIRIVQAGAILEQKLVDEVEREEHENRRYSWLGEVPEEEARQLIAESDALVLSSRSEGGPLVVAEAAVAGTPVLSTRIDGVVGMLGADYEGYFEVGDEQSLADLLMRFEGEEEFQALLKEQVQARAPRFHPEREKESWRALLASYCSSS